MRSPHEAAVAYTSTLMAFVSSAAASAHATWRAAARASCRVLNPAAAAFAARLVSAQLSRARFFSFSFEMAIASLKLAGSMRCHATRDAHEALDHDRVGHLRSLGLALFCARRVHLVLELEGLGSPARIVGVWAIRRVCPVLKVRARAEHRRQLPPQRWVVPSAVGSLVRKGLLHCHAAADDFCLFVKSKHPFFSFHINR